MDNVMSLANLKIALQQSLDKNLPKILEDAVENLQVKIKRKSHQNIEDRGATPTGGSGWMSWRGTKLKRYIETLGGNETKPCISSFWKKKFVLQINSMIPKNWKYL